jgi:hypothetical protein
MRHAADGYQLKLIERETRANVGIANIWRIDHLRRNDSK